MQDTNDTMDLSLIHTTAEFQLLLKYS